MIKQIRSIWRLVYGLVTCGEMMCSTFALLSLVIYVFGVLGGRNSPAHFAVAFAARDESRVIRLCFQHCARGSLSLLVSRLTSALSSAKAVGPQLDAYSACSPDRCRADRDKCGAAGQPQDESHFGSILAYGGVAEHSFRYSSSLKRR